MAEKNPESPSNALAEPLGKSQLGAIDAARGAALLLVCLSHFADAYFKPLGYGRTFELVNRVVMIASPTFMMMSGAMLGLLYARQPRHFGSIRAKLIDRGVFLVTIAHVLIAGAHLPFVNAPSKVLRWGFITDAIGVSLVAGPLLVGTLRPAGRVAVGAVLYLGSFIAVYAWQPAALTMRLLKDALVGPNADNSWEYNFPILPWFAVYFASSAIGAWLADRAAAGRLKDVPRACAKMGVLAIALAGATRGVVRLASGWLTPAVAYQAHELTSTVQKIPPGPCYLLAYGGVGLLLVGGCFAAGQSARLRRVLSGLQLLGQNSLFIFVFQYYLYYFALSLCHLRPTVLWPLYFGISIALLFGVVKGWTALNGNRLITVGLARRARAKSEL